MLVNNATQQEVFYWLSTPGSVDCGTLDAGCTQPMPGYDNQPSVSASFQPNSGTTFNAVIPESGVGTAVTIGLYFE